MLNLRDMVDFRIRKSPDRVALRQWETGEAYTWRDLYNRRNRMARFLTESLGLQKGDRVAFLCGNDLPVIDTLLATCCTGVIVDVLNQRLVINELLGMARQETPKAIFYLQQYKAKALALREAVEAEDVPCALVSMDAEPEEGGHSLAEVEELSAELCCPYEPEPEDIQMLIHTGGTTGVPKAAMISHRCITMNAVTEVISWRLTEKDRAYAAMPFYHTAGWNVLLLPTLMAGGEVTLSHQFSPDCFLDLVESGCMTAFMGADAMFRKVAASPRFYETDFSSVRFLCCGGGPLSQEMSQKYLARSIRLFPGYGMTEYGPNVSCYDPDVTLKYVIGKPLSIGKPLMFTEVTIADDEGNELGPNQIGEIRMRGCLAFSGYWNNPEASEAMWSHGWLCTGDMGYIDDDGDITICDRKKNMFISGGENVFPLEIERKLEELPLIKEACVFGVPDEQWGEVGKALIVVEEGAQLNLADLLAWVKEGLSTIKCPHYYEIVSEIPMNTAGKRDMKAIKALHGEELK